MKINVVIKMRTLVIHNKDTHPYCIIILIANIEYT